MTRYYTTGAFAKRAHVTVRTLRWYDAQNLLRPARKDDNGRRYYTDADMVKLQQILLFKYLGFSLDEIREMTLASADSHFLLESMRIQQKLVEERIEEMKAVSTSLAEGFNEEIRLSREPLYEKFGLANGRDLLSPWFSDIEERRYEDAIETKDAECLISYILSCHGNQNQLLVDHYREFRDYVIANTKDGFHITKDAGIFLCKKK